MTGLPFSGHAVRLAGLAIGLSLMASGTANCAETITYSYDAQGRLVNVVHVGTINNGLQTAYTFDLADNRTNVTVLNALSRVVVVPLNGFTVIQIPDP